MSWILNTTSSTYVVRGLVNFVVKSGVLPFCNSPAREAYKSHLQEKKRSALIIIIIRHSILYSIRQFF
jgi:hypothetical protein